MTTTRRSVFLAPTTALALAAGALLPAAPGAAAIPDLTAASAAGSGVVAPPTLVVETVVDGLDIPWDVAFVGRNMIYTERSLKRISVRLASGEVRVLADSPAGMWSSGETGLMGVVADPGFDRNRRIYTCHGYEAEGTRDIRVVRWVINEEWTAATQQADVVTGIEITSGRHGGCRLRFAPDGALYIGTGDSAVGTNPQDKTSLNGKTLRVDPRTGDPWPGNPYIRAADENKRLVYTYGHRNLQGLAWRQGQGMWSAEHGSYRDDEVNRLKAGGNYGWNPVPGYDESVPMTDHSLPGRQIDARWSSGNPTIATSGITWLQGRSWGDWRGWLAVGVLAGEELRLIEFDRRGRFVSQYTVPELDGDVGRIRTAQMGPDNALYLTTSNGGGTDVILKVTATS